MIVRIVSTGNMDNWKKGIYVTVYEYNQGLLWGAMLAAINGMARSYSFTLHH